LTPSAIEATAELTALGYIGVRSTRLDDWGAFATRLLGMQHVNPAGAVRAFRMDDRKQRLIVTGDDGEGLGFLGWEVADAAALDALASRLDAHGMKVRRALADERHVADLIVFQDPAGNRLEVFQAPAIAGDPFPAGPADLGVPRGPARYGTRRAQRQRRRKEFVMSERRLRSNKGPPRHRAGSAAASASPVCANQRSVRSEAVAPALWPTDGDGKRIVQHSVAVSQ
jgi:catechol 2,3-dioxygenase-like lactoylglutathione lyase family enzyme